MQIGNAVSPLLSANLGECLLLAVAEESPIGEGAIKVQLQEYEKAYEACKEEGIGFWCEQPGNVVEQVSVMLPEHTSTPKGLASASSGCCSVHRFPRRKL